MVTLALEFRNILEPIVKDNKGKQGGERGGGVRLGGEETEGQGPEVEGTD